MAPWLSCLLTLAVVGAIFYFSSQPADESSAASGRVVRLLLRLFARGFDALSAAEQRARIDASMHFVRKLAHFTEYAALGAALALQGKLLWRVRPVCQTRRLWLWAWAAGTLCAGLDELFQRTVSGRNGQLTDVLLDSAGVLTGTLLLLLLWGLTADWRARKRQ